MRLTKKQTQTLQRILRHLERGERYVFGDRVRVCRVDTVASTTRHYTRADGEGEILYPVERQYGSDLCALDTASKELAAFIVQEGFQPRG